MKKIVTTTTPGGAPIRLPDFKTTFNDEIWDAMQALLSGYDADTEGLIVSGCVISGAGPYNMTAGIVYLNGEFMRIEAQTGLSLPQYIQPDSTVDTSRQFEDNTTQVLFQEKSATVDGSAPGAGQYVAITSSTDIDRRLRKPVTIDPASVSQIIKKVINIGVWDMDSSSTLAVAHGISDYTKIKSVFVMIRTDDDAFITSMYSLEYNPGVLAAGSFAIDSVNINMARSSGIFDDPTFNKTSGSFNRGWITIEYEA